jgi:hypothetical protein
MKGFEGEYSTLYICMSVQRLYVKISIKLIVHSLCQGWPTRPASGAALWEATVSRNHALFHSFCKCLLNAAMLSKKRKYEDENREFKTYWEEVFGEKSDYNALFLKTEHY